MSWNYRVTKQKVGTPKLGFEDEYAIREVYYRRDGAIQGWTVDAMAPVAESKDELIEVMKRMTSAFGRPVLDIDNTECVGFEREDAE